jgi:hypothetical protein
MEKIKKIMGVWTGLRLKTKNKGDYHTGTNLIVKRIIENTKSPKDSIVYLEAETKIKYKRHYNKFNCRLWWVLDYCERV